MKKLQGILLAMFAFSAIAILAGCGSGGATEEEVKKDMSNIDKGLEGVPQLPPEAAEGPIPKGPKGGGPAAGG
jgi:uncharacterized lipoprotein